MPAENRTTLLIVDDDRGLLRLMEKALRPLGFTTATAASGQQVLEWLGNNRADLMILDLKLEDYESKELIGELSSAGLLVPFIIITGQGDERVAVDMMKRGALDYLVKDIQFIDLLPTVVARTIEQLDRDRKLKSAEEALHVSEDRFRIALKNSPISVFSQDTDLRYVWFYNPPTGFSDEQFLGKKDDDVFSADEANRLTILKQRVLRTAAGVREEVKWTLNGSVRIYDLTIEPVVDAQGKPSGITGAAMDITERKRLEQEISQASEMEQRRIGQDLHDGICQHLAAIELMSQVLEQNLEKRSKALAPQAGDIARNVRDTIAQTRSLARGLSPVELELEGLMSALTELAENTTKLFRVDCQFICETPVLIANNTVATHLYRIAQEAVSNAIRHGKAKKVRITLARSEDKIVLTVHDNGSGFSQEAVSKGGLGLRIMQYRAGMSGGNLTIQTGREGTTVTCNLPVGAANAKTK